MNDTPAPAREAAEAAAGPMAAQAGRWGDLPKRMWSAGAMIAIGAAEVWLGGGSFALIVIVLTTVMIWELASMTEPTRYNTPLTIASIAAGSLLATILLPENLSSVFLMLPALALALTPRRDRRIAAFFGVAILVAGYGLIDLRTAGGTPAFLWLVGVVIVSDVLGYFVGRTVGGPKFWPTLSPKKTWSGTIAGWFGGAAIGCGFVLAGRADWMLVLLSPLVAFAGQMGDIGESWIKRRCGVKDSSRLIPGHGGVMDRFDALVGAVVAVMLLSLVIPLPFPMPVGGP